MLGERPSAHFQDHRGALSRRVIILLNPVDDSLTRRKIANPLAAYGVRNSAALRRVLTLGFYRNGAMAEDVQFSFSEGLLIQLSPLGGRRDRVKNPRIRDARFRIIRNELVAIGSYSNAGKSWFFRHGCSLPRGLRKHT